MTELELILRDAPAWTVTSDGNAVTRAEWLAIVIDEMSLYDPLAVLVETITADPRKSFTKAKLLELINEFR